MPMQQHNPCTNPCTPRSRDQIEIAEFLWLNSANDMRTRVHDEEGWMKMKEKM
jgi:hypothetical protein